MKDLEENVTENYDRDRHPKHFKTLSEVSVRFKKSHYARDYPVDLEWEQPHIVLGETYKRCHFYFAIMFA